MKTWVKIVLIGIFYCLGIWGVPYIMQSSFPTLAVILLAVTGLVFAAYYSVLARKKCHRSEGNEKCSFAAYFSPLCSISLLPQRIAVAPAITPTAAPTTYPPTETDAILTSEATMASFPHFALFAG